MRHQELDRNLRNERPLGLDCLEDLEVRPVLKFKTKLYLIVFVNNPCYAKLFLTVYQNCSFYS